MFHLAPPEVNGFGVSTCTPGLIRSSQVLRFFGLPLRTPITATESVIMPLYWSLFQLASTSLAVTRRVMSGSSEKATRAALRPAATAPLWSPEAPDEWGNLTVFAASVARDAARSFS